MRLPFALAAALLTAACDNRSDPTPHPVPPWTPGRAVPTSALTAPRGLHDYRGIVHLHSPFSHDACDGHTGNLTDAQCLIDLRRGLCDTGQDFAYLTDHPANFRDHEFPEALLYMAGDTLVMQGGKPVANWIACGNGRRVLLQAGYESSMLMPVALHEHAAPTGTERNTLYDSSDTATVLKLQGAGAAVFIPHTESKDFDWYSKLPIAAQEIYNIHANLDPRIRKNDLGLDEAGYFGTLLKFTSQAETGPYPDLALLSFFEENRVDLEKWDRILLLKKVAGVAGTDAHQNVFVNKMRDGERGDSYRRLMSFFSNHILVDGALDADVPKNTLVALRAYVAFEAFGAPTGFDFRADTPGGVVEMGGDAPSGESTIVLKLPTIYGLDAQSAKPVITGVIYRITAGGRAEAARGTGGELRINNPAPGVYRAEVWIEPNHLKPFLGDLAGALIHPYPWLYANPIFVR